MKECGKEMGGIWIPHSKGSIDYIPVRCNLASIHGGRCMYLDDRSGMAVVQQGSPIVEVDRRGCIVEANSE